MKKTTKKAPVKRAAKKSDNLPAKKDTPLDVDLVANLVLNGDISKMTPDEKTKYYINLCRSLSLNPYTQPFAILRLSGKEVMYAQKGATDQLRSVHGVSVETITQNIVNDICVTTVTVKDKTGRVDGATGAVSIGGLRGDALANALMKSETKAKRRATLSICGLGMLDETDIEMINGATSAMVNIGQTTPVTTLVDVPDDTALGEAIGAIDGAKDGRALVAIQRKYGSMPWTADQRAELTRVFNRRMKELNDKVGA